MNNILLTEDKTFSLEIAFGLGTILNDYGIKIYPNPTNSFINVSTISIFDKIEIHNIEGQKLKTISSELEKPINIENFDSGIYVVSIYKENKLLQVTKMSIIK